MVLTLLPVKMFVQKKLRGELARGCFSFFVQSRSDPAMVAAAFKPRWQGKQDVRRGATVEINAAERIQASLRDAISWGDLSRGLKSTATVQASLREVRAASQIFRCCLLACDIV